MPSFDLPDSINTLEELDKVVERVRDEFEEGEEDNSNQNLSMMISYQNDGGNLEGYSLSVNFDSELVKERMYFDEEEVKEKTKSSAKGSETLSEFVDAVKGITNASRIFNSIFPVVKEDYIGQRVPIIYNQLQQLKMIEKKSRTFAVGYNDALKRYVMYYNPEFMIEFAIKEYFNSKSKYNEGDFKNCFIYNLMFILSHEMMHIIRNHTQDRVSLVKDVNPQIVNILGDAFINMDLEQILNDSRLVNKPVKPSIGITNEVFFQGNFKSELRGDTIREIGSKFHGIIQKYTATDLFRDSRVSNSDGNVPTQNPRFALKFYYPKGTVSETFQDNSSNFIKCFNEIFEALGGVEEIKNDRVKPDLKKGTPVRVKSSGDRGVIVEELEDKLKVAASTAVEGDDEKTVEDYDNDEIVDILGDFESEELKPISKVYDSPEDKDDSEGEQKQVDEDEVEIEDHTSDSDSNNSSSSQSKQEEVDDGEIHVGDTVKVNGKIGVVNKVTADGKVEVEGIRILELFLYDKLEKTGDIIGIFDPEEVTPYDVNKGSGESDSEGNTEDEDQGGQGDSESQEGDSEQTGDNQEEDLDDPDDEDMGLPDDEDQEGQEDEGDSDDTGSGSGSGDSGGGERESEEQTSSQSKIDDLFDDIVNSKDETTKAQEENDEKQEEEMEEMSGQQQKEARDKLKDDIKKSVRDAAKRQGLSDEEKKIMKGIGLDRVTDIPEVSKGQWNKALNRILSNALSIKSTYNPNRPSRRIPDAFGSSTIEKDIKDIVLALDCSGSMGAPQFKESIRHIQTFLNSLRGVNPKFHLILWGGSPDALEYVRIPHKDDVAKTMMSKGGQRNWGTDPQYMFQYIMDNIWNKPDAVIIFTDGQFWSEPTREIESYIRRNQDRLVWVLTSNGTIRNAKKFDPTVEMLPRYIKQGKG